MTLSLNSRPSFFNTLTGMERTPDYRAPFQALHVKAKVRGSQTNPKLYTGRFWGTSMSGSDALTKAISDGFDRLSAPILISSLILTAFLASFLVPLPEFTTDMLVYEFFISVFVAHRFCEKYENLKMIPNCFSCERTIKNPPEAVFK